MLVTLNEVLNDAQRNHYGVGLFNTINFEMARGVIEAAEELDSPVIIGTAESLTKYTPLKELSWLLKPLAEEASVPVVLHFDHGLTEAKIVEALKLGFSSIMYDCSTFPYEENVERVARMTEFAHMFGVTVEGELGHVGANDNPDAETDMYTTPEEAADYAARTGIDALAVAIGTAHGEYREKPVLDLERLAEIRAAVDVPLVLHGGSGLSDEDFRNCIKGGICKVNIYTDINLAAAHAVAAYYNESRKMDRLIPEMVAAVKAATIEKMMIFGSQGKA